MEKEEREGALVYSGHLIGEMANVLMGEKCVEIVPIGVNIALYIISYWILLEELFVNWSQQSFILDGLY